MANNFFDQFDPAPSGGNFFDQFDPKQPTKPPAERSVGRAIADTTIGVAQGVVGVAKLIPMAVGAADTVVSKAFGLGEPVTGGALANPVTRGLDDAQKSLQSMKSDYIQAKEADADKAAAEVGKRFEDVAVIGGVPVGRIAAETVAQVGEYLSDPSLLVQGVAQNIASIIPSGLAARGTQVAAEAVIPKVATALTEKAVLSLARTAGVAGGISMGAVQQGSDVASETYGKVMELPDEVWQQNPRFTELVEQIGEKKAKDQIAAELATEAGVKSGIQSLVVNAVGAKFGGATLESAFLKPVKGADAAGRAVAGSSLKGFAKGSLGEAITEAPEEGYGALATNQAIAQVDPTTDIYQGVGSAAGKGAATAFAMGGVAGAREGLASGLISRQRALAEDALRAAPDAGSAAAAANELAGSVAEFESAAQELTPSVDAYLGRPAAAPAGATGVDQAIAQATQVSGLGAEAVPGAEAIAPPGPELTPAQLEGQRIAGLRSMVDRDVELLGQADAAGTAFDRRMALEQAQVARGEPTPMGPRYEDLTPMTPEQADRRLIVMRDMEANEGGDALSLAVVPHPGQAGMFAIGRQSLPSLDLESAPAAQPSAAEAQNRIESAALAGDITQRRAEDGPRQAMISRTMANIEARGGVASPAEAELLRQANMGQPYNRIDPGLAQRQPSVDEKLTAATGIAVGTEAGLGNRPRSSTTITPPAEPFRYDPTVQGRRTEPTELPIIDARTAFVNDMSRTSTPAAQAFMREYRAGRITDADVQAALEVQRRGAATPTEIIKQAAAQQPAPPAGRLVVAPPAATPRVSPVLAEAVTLYGNKPYTNQDLTAEGSADRLATAASIASADTSNVTPGGLQVEPGLAPRADFQGRQDTVAQANRALPPRPQRIQGVPVAQLTDAQLTQIAGDQSAPAISRRGASVELEARAAATQARGAAARADAGAAEVQSRLETAAAQGRLSQPSNGLIITSGAKLSTQRQAPGGTITINDGDQQHTVTVVEPSRLGFSGRVLGEVARVFGKRLVTFTSDTARVDGFVLDGDNKSIFINANSQISPLAVFGHELTHLLKRDNETAYLAIQTVVERELGEGAMAQFEQEYGAGASLEELTSDLVGNRFQEASFWRDVFLEISAQQAEGARGVILRLAAAVNRAVNALLKVVNKPGFNADTYVRDLNAVKAAVKSAMVEYVQGQRPAAIALDREGTGSPEYDSGAIEGAQNARFSVADRDQGVADATGQDGRGTAEAVRRPSYGQAREGAVSVVGRHYSTGQRQTLSGQYYGRGLKGAERTRLDRSADPRLRQRVYFYVDQGNGIRPEAGVGGYAHEVRLDNIYDPSTGLVPGNSDLNAFESAVINAGFDGYMVRFGNNQAAAVLLGPKHQSVPVAYVGQPTAAAAPQGSGSRTLRKGLLSRELAAIDTSRVPGAQIRNGNLEIPEDQVAAANTELERIGSLARFASARADNRITASVVRKAVPEETEISTQNPQGKTRLYDPIDDMLSIDEAAVREAMALPTKPGKTPLGERIVDAILSYGFVPTNTPREEAIEVFKQNLVSNLLYLYNRVPRQIRERSKLWYDGANRIASEMGQAYGVKMEQVAGIMAAMSPQKDWFQNVSMAERALDILTQHGNKAWDDGMLAYAKSYVEETRDRKEREKRQKAYDRALEVAAAGTTLDQMDVDDAAVFIRSYDEAYHSRQYRIVTPEGGFGDLVRNEDGTPSTMMWSTYDPIAKSVSIFRDGSRRNISEQLGEEHKIRSFYNNIASPNSPISHVTIDTHAVAAGLFEALAGTDTEVTDNFGGTGGSSLIGVGGTYGIIADAYRTAARIAGVQAREMQSITWEAVRGLFGENIKSSIKPKVKNVWQQFRDGKISFAGARRAIVKIAERYNGVKGGIHNPDWVGSGAGDFVANGGASYDKSFVPAGGVRLREAKELRERVTVNVSAATSSIPGLKELYSRAMSGEAEAANLLQRVAESSLRFLLGGTKARLTVADSTGVYMADREPSVSIQVAFDESESGPVLGALAQFAESYNQQQIHVRKPTIQPVGHEFGDGSYATPVYTIPLDRTLTNDEISAIIEDSGLQGFTVTADTLTAYWVQPTEETQDADELQTFKARVARVQSLAGQRGGRPKQAVERLFVYGEGFGARIPYSAIRGDVRTRTEADLETPRLIAEYLNRGPIKTFKQKPLTTAQVKQQRALAKVFDQLPTNDLDRPIVRQAYDALAQALKDQFSVLPIKVEVMATVEVDGQAYPYWGPKAQTLVGKLVDEGLTAEQARRAVQYLQRNYGTPSKSWRTGPLAAIKAMDGEPYPNSSAMRRDVSVNNRFRVYKTSPATFGPPGSDFSAHPLLQDSGLEDVNGYPMLYNDVLRAVHDYFAHNLSATQFGPVGEAAAWRNHMASTPDPLARWALTAETRLQNAWQNFRPGVENLSLVERGFADQKAALPPVEFTLTGDAEVDAPMQDFIKSLTEEEKRGSLAGAGITASRQRQTETPEFKRWFGDSKVVDENGDPLVVYHGTQADITEFRTGNGAMGEYQAGLYFADDSNLASIYGRDGAVYPVYLSIKNPLDLTDRRVLTGWRGALAKLVAPKLTAEAKRAESLRKELTHSLISPADRERLLAAGYDGVKGAGGVWIALNPTQVKSATGNSGAFDPTNPNITASRQRTPLGFYSALADALDNIKTNAAPAAGWKDAIKGLVNKGQVKADEVEWTGINDWLDLQTGRVTKDQVGEYLKAGGVRVEETVLEPEESGMALDSWMEDWAEANPSETADAILDGEAWDDIRKVAEREGKQDVLRRLDAKIRPSKYDRYTLPGGRNYREVLLTLPQSRREAFLERAYNLPELGERTPAQQAEFDRLMYEYETPYRSSHWDQPDVLAHVRVNDRVDADGNRVLFVEEIQSDWGQEGKKKGFKQEVDRAAIEGRMQEITRRLREIAKSGVDESPEMQDEWNALSDEKSQLTEQLVRSNAGVPLAPFVTKTEGWLNLALKRIAVMAAEGGYDKVAFVDGKQSADRYDLSKQVEKIEYVVNPNGTYEMTVSPLAGRDIVRDELTETDLEELVGKEIAQRIVNGEGTENRMGVKTLRDVDLKVGGEGMKAFYDKIVPNAVNALLKKLGGGKLETVQMTADPNPALDAWEAEDGPGDGSKAPVEQLTQPGFTVTDAMRAKVDEGLPLFSRQRIVGDSSRAYTPEQLAMFQNVGRTVTTPTLKERLAELRQDLGKKMAQGLADQFRPLRELGTKAYTLARLSRGSAGAFEALLHHGKLSITDGAYDADMSGGFIERVGVPLHGELEDFLWWVAANRAERLTREDRENLFTSQDITAGKSLDNGTTDFDYVLQHGARAGQKTRDRTLIYRDALKTFDEFNKNTLDMAEQSGLIDAASRPFWEHEFYVPFYRVSDEDGSFIGAKMSNQLVRQRAFKRLKGGAQKLNSDLLANTLQNWGHLIDAAAKNRAAKESLEAAANMGVAVEADQATVAAMAKSIGKRGNTVWFMDQGRERYFLVDDPMVLTAITSLEFTGLRGPIMDALSTAKHWLTIGVTASPAFKIRNLVRDSIQAIATSDLSYNPIANVRDGLAASDRSSQTYVSALASGGLIRFGTMLEGKQSDHVRRLVRGGVKDSTILDSDHKVRAMYERYLAPAVEAYNEIGNRGEEINRAALFAQLKRQGVDQATAALLARDLMDFSMQGSWASIRFLTQVVPFMNARIQGLYKLGRAGAENPGKMAAVLGATALASIALLLAYQDDDDWKKREDWDRNNFWWFKIGGVAFRVPKPFEIGAMATLAERGLEYFINPEMTGKRLYSNMKDLVLDSLSMNPVPQLAKPLIDLYSNKDSFTKRPIETMGMERLEPQYRYTQRTSMVARGLSNATLGALSPVQYDHLLRGYFGWLGSFAVGAADMIVRPLTSEPTRPTADYWKLATQGILAEVDSGGSRYVSQMYEQAKELEQAMGTYRMLMKTGRTEEAREYFRDNKEAIVKYGSVERIKSAETRYNEAIRMIERSNLDPDVKKERIRAIQQQKDRVARVVAPGYQR